MSVTLNTDWLSGFGPVQGIGGSASFRMRRYTVLAAYNTDIPSQAFVILDVSDGGVEVFPGGATAHGGEILGISVNPVLASASSDDEHIWVYDDPDQIFEGQFDDNSVTAISGLQGKYFEVTSGNATLNSVTNRSQGEVDATTVSSTSTNNTVVQAVDISQAVDTLLRTGTAADRARVQFKINPAAHIFA